MKSTEKLETRYEVRKLANPGKVIDSIVLEFDDPIARIAIRAWAKAMGAAGYKTVERQVNRKVDAYDSAGGSVIYKCACVYKNNREPRDEMCEFGEGHNGPCSFML